MVPPQAGSVYFSSLENIDTSNGIPAIGNAQLAIGGWRNDLEPAIDAIMNFGEQILSISAIDDYGEEEDEE